MSSVAYEALNLGKANTDAMTAHEDLCAERYGNIHSMIGEIKSVLKWFGSTLFVLLVATLAWSLKQQYSANDYQKQAMAAKLEAIEQQPRPVIQYAPPTQEPAPARR